MSFQPESTGICGYIYVDVDINHYKQYLTTSCGDHFSNTIRTTDIIGYDKKYPVEKTKVKRNIFH